MNPHLKHSMPSLALLDEPSVPAPSAEPLAKPKVMRRPAQFSTSTHHRSEPQIIADIRIDTFPAENKNAATSIVNARHWQDDARFAFALLAIVILVNLTLSIWLAPATTAPETSVGTQTDMSAIPPASAAESLVHQLNQAGSSVSEQ